MSRRLVGTALAAVAVLTVAWARISAHPAADTEVVITLDGRGAFEVTLTTARDPLLLKLEALAGKAADVGVVRSRARRPHPDVTVDAARTDGSYSFDNKPTPLTLTAIDRVAARPDRVVIRFGGRLPAGASSLQWSTGIVYGSYVFAVRRDGGNGSAPTEAFEWINGPARSNALQSRRSRHAAGAGCRSGG